MKFNEMEKWRQKWVWQFRRAQCSVPKPVALALSATPKAGNFVDKCGRDFGLCFLFG